MCGRFALSVPKSKIENYFNITIPFDLPLRFNIAPTQQTLVLCTEDKLPQMMYWGFVPFWAKDKSVSEQINAKYETLHEKPMFRQAFKEHRCIVIASGFYEWAKEEQHDKVIRTPFYITDKKGDPMVFAGIWDRNVRFGQIGFSIVTTVANTTIKKYHDRMPLMLDTEEKIGIWLKSDFNLTHIQQLYSSTPAKELSIYEVSRLVNNPRNDTIECIMSQHT